MLRPTLADAAEAVCDGTAVDWAEALRLAADEEQPRLQELRRLANYLGARPGLPSATSAASATRISRPVLLGVLIGIASVQCLIGATGFFLLPVDQEPVPRILQLSVTLGLAGAAVFLLTSLRHDPRATLLAGVFLVLGSACSQRFIPASEHPVLAFALKLYPEAFLPALMWAFVRRFPAALQFSPSDRALQAATQVSGAVGAVLFLANALLALPLPGILHQQLTIAERGGSSTYWLLIFSMTLPALVVMPWRALRAPADERRRVQWFLFGLSAGFAPSTLEVIAEVLVPAYDRLTSTQPAATIVGLVLYGSLLTIPVTTTYAVAARRVFGVRAAIHRGLRYALTRDVFIALTLLPVMLLIRHLYVHRARTIAELWGSGPTLMLLGASAGGAILIWKREWLLALIDRLFGARTIRVPLAAAAALERIATARNGLELAAVARQHIAAAAAAPSARIFVRKPERDWFESVEADAPHLAAESALVQLLAGAVVPLDFGGGDRWLLRTLPAEERQWVAQVVGQGLLAGALSQDSAQPVVMLAVGAKHTGVRFSADEAAFVQTVTSALAMAISQKPELTGRDDEEPARECPRCARMFDARTAACECGMRLATASIPGCLAGKFRPLRRLGRGGMGLVYEAADQTLGRRVALKTLPQASRPGLAQLRDEARTMAAVSHPNLAAIHALETWRGLPIIVMELLEGGTLMDRLRNGPLPRHDAARVLPALAAALDCLHERGIVHADIKPANIGFTREGTPKLMDFGLAALAGEADGRHGGTLLYLSPERIKGEPPTKGSDIWALAVVAWECLVGVHPFWRAQSPEELLTLMSVGVDEASPTAVRRALHGALSEEVSRRPSSASSLVETVLSAVDGP